MLFKNKSDDDRTLTRNGVVTSVVPRGESHVVTVEEAPGFVLQCGPDGAWEPADDEAKAAVEQATKAAENGPPAESAVKAEWVAYAEGLGDTDAAAKTKQQLIDEHGDHGQEG